MRTFVTTFADNRHLETFLLLTARFYPVDIFVDKSESPEAKSDQLRRLLESIDDEYLILLEEDFYLLRPVDLQLLDQVCDFCVEKGVDRFSLQSKNAYRVSDWSQSCEQVGSHPVYEAPLQATLFALEASVWKRSFLLNHLRAGCSDGQIEMEESNEARRTSYRICALDVLVMEYCDAMRGGETLIYLQDNPLRLTGKGLEYWSGDSGVLLL